MSEDLALRSEPAPLVELARLGQLPRHQYMDAVTLRWIEEHQPHLGGVDVPLPDVCADLRRLPDRWFADTRLVQSIHGLRHHARVAIYAGHLAEWLGLDARDHREAVLAGAIHDCRRHHDQDDPGHGARTAAWFERTRDEVRCLLSPGALVRHEVVAVAVELHDVPHAEFSETQLDGYRRSPEVVDVVKTADALDRYRLPKLKWWPDPSRMTLNPPGWLHWFAWRLVIATERKELADSVAAATRVLSRGGMSHGSV